MKEQNEIVSSLKRNRKHIANLMYRNINIEEYIFKLLCRLGIDVCSKGFGYIKEVLIVTIYFDLEVINQINDLHYLDIAKKYGTSIEVLKLEMQKSIDIAWENESNITFHNMFEGEEKTVKNLTYSCLLIELKEDIVFEFWELA